MVDVEDVEQRKEKECQAADRAELDKAMAKCTKFIEAPVLIVLRVIRNCDENLQPDYQKYTKIGCR